MSTVASPVAPTASGEVELGTELSELLRRSAVKPRLAGVAEALADACAQIARVLRGGAETGGGTDAVGTHNAFGDAQLEADLRADAVIVDALRRCRAVATVSSEEKPSELAIANDSGRELYSVAFDPLDGSSIVDVNWSVGTIFGIWPGSRLVGTSGKELVCSGCAVYGPRTTLYMAFACEAEVCELTLSLDGKWRVTRRIEGISAGKLYAPANMRCAQDNAGYQRLLDLWAQERYTLRYTGGMVPDICQLLVKGKGVFASPVSPKAPAKLRLLYEALPMAFLVEKAGGASTDGSLDSILKSVVFCCDDRTPICVGSSKDVQRFREHCPRVFDK